jgi:hypothetical protein
LIAAIKEDLDLNAPKDYFLQHERNLVPPIDSAIEESKHDNTIKSVPTLQQKPTFVEQRTEQQSDEDLVSQAYQAICLWEASQTANADIEMMPEMIDTNDLSIADTQSSFKNE